jgi:transposase InsO family protein
MIVKRPMVAFLTQLLLAIRSQFIGMAVSTLPVAPGRDHHRPAGDLAPLAPTWFPRLLALEVPPGRRSPADRLRDASADPADEPREPAVGAPRIHGELLMLGIEVAESTVGRYVVRRRRPPSQGWKAFLRNHAAGIASLDLFVVRTISFNLLYGLVILRHARRQLVTISITCNPTAEWIAGQVTDAFPWDEALHHLIRDRDGAFGPAYTHRIRAMGIRDHPTAPRSPWQNGHVERLIGSIRRESLDHLVVFDEAQLRRVLRNYAFYYNQVRTHLSLRKNAPDFRRPQKTGRIAAIPILGGLHHQYVRV